MTQDWRGDNQNGLKQKEYNFLEIYCDNQNGLKQKEYNILKIYCDNQNGKGPLR